MPKDYLGEGMPLRESQQLISQFEKMLLTNESGFFSSDSYEYMIHYYESGFEFDKAEAIIHLASSQYPYACFFALKKAQLLLDARQYTEALSLLDQAAALSPADTETMVLKAECYTHLAQFNAALHCLHQALQRTITAAEKAELYLAIADVYEAGNRPAEAYRFMKRVLKLQPTHEGALSRIDDYIVQQQRYQQSITIHRWITNEEPFCYLAWYNLGNAYAGLERYQQAIQAYEFATLINEQYDLAYLSLGNMYYQLADYNQAKQQYLIALSLGETDDELLLRLAASCYHLQQIPEAIQYLQTILASKTHHQTADTHTLLLLADCLIQQQQWKDALVYLKQTAAIAPQNTHNLRKMAYCFEQMGNSTHAIACYQRLIDLHPAHVPHRCSLVQLHFYAQNYETALLELSTALADLGKHPALFYQQAACCYAIGLHAEALACFSWALAADAPLRQLFFDMLPQLAQQSAFSAVVEQFITVVA